MMKKKNFWVLLCIVFALPACQQQTSNISSVEDDMHAAKVREVEEWLGQKLHEADSVPKNAFIIPYDSLKPFMEKYPDGVTFVTYGKSGM